MITREERRDLLLRSGLALSSELSLDAVLQRIVEAAVKVTEAQYGALGVLGPGGEIIEFHTIGVSEAQRAAIGHTPVGKGILGVLIHDAQVLRLHDIAADPRSVGFPPNHPPMSTFLGAPVKARGTVFGNIYLTEKRGGADFDEEDEAAVTVLAAQAGVAVENATLYEAARRRERWLQAVHESMTAILAGLAPEAVLELVARQARELVAADLATIAVPTQSGDSLVLQVVDGMHAEDLVGTEFPIEGSASGQAIRDAEPLVLDDAADDERAHQPIVSSGELGPAMFLPLSVRGSAFGTLGLANRRGGRRFSEEDVALVRAFAGQASVAIEYGRAQRELQRLSVMEDRERIARELHDGVIQSLFAVGMGLQGAAMLSDDPELERRIGGAVEEVDRVIRDLRNYIFGLRPGILADRQLDQALRRLVEEFQERTGIVAVADVDPAAAAELSSQAGDVVQLVREALSNVGRHSKAATCRVSLGRRDGGFVLEVDDDGTGFDPGEAADIGQGLGNLRRRAEALAGRLSIESSPGEGTTVRVTIDA